MRVQLCAKVGDRSDLYPYIEANELLASLISLFAEVPSLAKQLLERSKGNDSSGKVATFFDDLFEISSGSALGADHKLVVHYRLRDVNQGDLASGALNGDVQNFDGHKITPEMIKRGAHVVADYFDLSYDGYTAENISTEVLRAAFSEQSNPATSA